MLLQEIVARYRSEHQDEPEAPGRLSKLGVKKSAIDGASGGCFALEAIPTDVLVGPYVGKEVKLSKARSWQYDSSYCLQVGKGQVLDAADEEGELFLDDTVVSREPGSWTDAEWATLLPTDGEAATWWSGEELADGRESDWKSNVLRFINAKYGFGTVCGAKPNVAFGKGPKTGQVWTTRPIEAGEELASCCSRGTGRSTR